MSYLSSVPCLARPVVGLLLLFGLTVFSPHPFLQAQVILDPVEIPVDTDRDGLPDAEEQGPDGEDVNFDGNTDGIPDYRQVNVVSFNSWDKQHYLTLAAEVPAHFHQISVFSPEQIAGSETTGLDYGFVRFELDVLKQGAFTILRVFLLHEDRPLTSFYQFSPLESGQPPRLLPFRFNCDVGAEWYNSHILLHLVDGFPGDGDLAANGLITATIAPGFGQSPLSPTDGPSFLVDTDTKEKTLTVTLPAADPESIRMVQVLEVNDGVILEKRADEGQVRQLSLDIETLQCGLYLVRVFTASGPREEKILISQ